MMQPLRTYALRLTVVGLSVFLSAFLFNACKTSDPTITPKAVSITELLANGNGPIGNQFTMLGAALKLAGLDAALGQSGTYTLLAPTDAAFQAMGYATPTALNALPAATLKAILGYHLMATPLSLSSVTTGQYTPLTMSDGNTAYLTRTVSTSAVSTTATVTSVNGARLLSAGTAATNGTVYVIDRVLLPPMFGNVVGTLTNLPTFIPMASFTLLNAAVAKAGLVSSLTATGPITVFAPTDAAFTAARPDLKTAADVAALPADTLRKILGMHIVPGRVYVPTMAGVTSLSTVQGAMLTPVISTTALSVQVQGSKQPASNVTARDITATNGVIHLIDRLLLP